MRKLNETNLPDNFMEISKQDFLKVCKGCYKNKKIISLKTYGIMNMNLISYLKGVNFQDIEFYNTKVFTDEPILSIPYTNIVKIYRFKDSITEYNYMYRLVLRNKLVIEFNFD